MAEVTAKQSKLLPDFLSLPVLRPMATAMLFVAIIILGAVGINRMPVQILPPMPTDNLYVNFFRPGSTADVVEREILIPLTSRINGLQGVKETLGQIYGEQGHLSITFDPGTNVKVREYEIRRIASKLQRDSAVRTTQISVSSADSSLGALDTFIMTVSVLGGDREVDQVYDLAVQWVVPRLSTIPGVARVQPTGGGGRQVIVAVDTDKTASLGATIEQVIGALNSKLGSAVFVGNFESESGRTNVIFDGKVDSLISLRQTRILPNSPLTVGHVADIHFGYAQSQSITLFDGNRAVGIALFQEQGSNVIEIGREVRKRIEELRPIVQPIGIDLKIGFDASESLDDQIQRLINLGLTGFAIALLVLFVFLRQWRAVAIVGIAVPVSLMTAVGGLYLLGQSINILTLFGLAMSVGLLVDNSVVVYEAILRGIERGITPTEAARLGLRKTARAIVGASVTTAVVFLPIFLLSISDAMFRQMLQMMSISVILPLFSSLFVALGLVPLLAHRLAAPAAVRRVKEQQHRRKQRGGMLVPDRARVLLAGLVTNALRQPASWLAGTFIAVAATILIAFPWAALNSSNPPEPTQADTVDFTIRAREGRSIDLDTLVSFVSEIGRNIKNLEGVDSVESSTMGQDRAVFNVHFVEENERPPDFNAVRIKEAAEKIAQDTGIFLTYNVGESDYASAGRGRRGYERFYAPSGDQEVIISGPDSKMLKALAEDLVARLREVNYVEQPRTAVQSQNREIWVEPDETALQAFGLTTSEALPFLQIAGQYGRTLQSPYSLPSGREIGVVVEREGVREKSVTRRDFNDMRIKTSQGVLPIASFARVTEMPAPAVIVHKNGRREMKVVYGLDRSVPDSGSGREAIENEIKDFIRSVPRPEGYVIDIPDADEENVNEGVQLGLTALGLVFLSLAIILESLILPVLVMVAVPLAILGTLWGLALTGLTFANPLAMAGFLVLIGLMVNPAILLIDRMQQLTRIGYSSGAAAYAAVKERTRPVLLTAATTIAALWPLSLATGAEGEIWPPFAIVVMSGLATSALLTLIIVPVGYVLLRRLDLLFGRVGPWLAIAWGVALTGIMILLIMVAGLKGLLWQVAVGLLVGGFLLALIVFFFRRVRIPEPDTNDGPPKLEVSYLSKIYGLPGPIRRTLNASRQFAQKVVEVGGRVFNRKETLERSLVYLILALGAGSLGWLTPERGWGLIFWLIAAAFVARVFLEIRKARGLVSDDGKAKRGGIEGVAVVLLPWLTIGGFVYFTFVRPVLNEDGTETSLFWPIVAVLFLGIGQLIRRSATRQERGDLPDRVVRGFMKYPRTWWRRLSRRIGGLDLPAEEIRALWSVSFTAERGMIGILGPNGAGKTTLLRQLAGIINPTRGAIKIGGVHLPVIQKVLARWIGYLPQDAGLPQSLTPRDYLQYYAALYDIDPSIRKERVASLIEEVGLAEKIDDKISSLSGGMRQRVAVARTLLRLPAIIIVDEPTVGLDPRERIRFRNLLARLAETRIVLFSTHVVEDVAISCERVLVIAKSRLRFDGSPSDLATNAEGKVWEQRIEQGQDKTLPDGAVLAEEAPDAAGDTVQRIISNERPSTDAKQLNPQPEDGYLWLLAMS